VIKYADDTAIIGLVTNNDESEYRKCVEYISSWCENHNLTLNVKKTKEMIFDFRKCTQNMHEKLSISGTDVEQVCSFKYLGVNITNNLNWNEHILNIVSKTNQRMYCLRKLRQFNVSPSILQLFYNSTICSVITYGMSSWYAGLTKHQCHCLDRIRKQSQKITGCELTDFQSLYIKQSVSIVSKILKDQEHSLFDCYKLLPSQKRLRSAKCKTKRFHCTFVPQSIKHYNNNLK
jgi:hypothetical protein